MSITRAITLAIAISVALVLLYLGLTVIFDQHVSVTKEMGWQCVGIQETGHREYPHVEVVKLWFVQNPRYEERASGPSLCAALKGHEASTVTAVFDVWGNLIYGLHGYNMVSLSLGKQKLQVDSGESGGYHGDSHVGNFNGEEDKRLHPDIYKFPLDVFR